MNKIKQEVQKEIGRLRLNERKKIEKCLNSLSNIFKHLLNIFADLGFKVFSILGFFLSLLAIGKIGLHEKDLQLGRIFLSSINLFRICLWIILVVIMVVIIISIIKVVVFKQWKKKYQ